MREETSNIKQNKACLRAAGAGNARLDRLHRYFAACLMLFVAKSMNALTLAG